MKKFLRIANIITVCFSSLAIILFMSFCIQIKLGVGASTDIFFKYKLEPLEHIELFYVNSTYFIFFSPISTVIALILFCIRWFIYKEKISLMFFILIIAEIVFVLLLIFDVGNMLVDVFD